MTWRRVRAQRVAAHSLDGLAPARELVDVVGRVCGIHAQITSAAELSIGVRVEVSREQIRAALWDKRTLVKTEGLRGTLHLFPARELPLWLAAIRAAEDARLEQRRLADLGLTRKKVDRLVDVIARALSAGPLSYRELGEIVTKRVRGWTTEGLGWFGGKGEKWRVAVGYAAASGVLVYGPPRGNEVTFVLTEQWLGKLAAVDGDAALATVFRRFLRAYGPATHRDFAQWLAMAPARARNVAASLGDEVEEVDVEGYRCLRLRDEAPPASARATVRLLPHFDCYLRGFHPRAQLMAGGIERERAGGGTGTVPVLLVDGAVAGVWERSRTKRGGSELVVDAFTPLSVTQRRELERACAQIGQITGSEPTLRLGTVAIRPHL
jgi:hypothetical protein